MNQHTQAVPIWALTDQQAWVATFGQLTKLTKEVKKMAQEIDDLKREVQLETEEDVLTAQTIADLNAKVNELQGKLDEADQLVADAKAGEQGALDQLEEVLQGVREATEELRQDNPPEPTPEPEPTEPTQP